MIFEWQIEDIFSSHPDLYLDHCAAMAVALLSPHATSSLFNLNCEGFVLADLEESFPVQIQVRWTEDTFRNSQKILATEQRTPLVERASVALTALLFAHFIPNSQMRVTQRGELADYWLPKLQCALEISGTEKVREVSRRRKMKAKQVLANPLGWPGYVTICCFAKSQPSIYWSFHSQPQAEEKYDEA